MKTLIAECHRRHVFRVAALYVVGAWVVLQVSDLAFEAWDIPSAALRYVWIGAVAGLPAALLFGWRYDVVGGTIVPTPDDDGTPAVPLQRIDYMVLSALGLVMAAVILSLAAEIRSVRDTRETREIVATVDLDPRSIAVLPFKDSSADADQSDILVNGIQDDLLTRLSKIGSLKVISRTSVERYRETALSIPDIGRELGVGRILEGGLQRVGDQIRINVQLIDTATDEHIWAETYDRSMTASNIFDIQTEIVTTISKQLEANLTPQESKNIASMPTRDLAAYSVYLKAHSLAKLETVESLNSAIAEFNKAVEMDPEFALAFVGLADAYLTLDINFFGGLTLDESLRFAEPPLIRALEIDPKLGQAYATLGRLRQQQNNYQAAEEAYKKAIELQPNYSLVFRSYGRLRWNQGRSDEAGEFFRNAMDLDPYSAATVYQYARYLDATGDFDAALEYYLQVADIEPDYAFTYVYIAAIHFLGYGRIDESMVWYQKAALGDSASPSLQSSLVIGYLEIDDPESARYWMDRAKSLGADTFWPMWVSLLLNLYVGEEDLAVQDARKLLDAYPTNWGAHKLLRNVDVRAGRYEVARSRYARAFRELVEPEIPQVDSDNYMPAVDFALVLIALGEQSRADDILSQSLEVIASMPRMGTSGYWTTDVQIYALQNRPEQALNALQEAFDEGWRLLTWFYLDFDPNLDSLRDHPRFNKLQADFRIDLEDQAQRVRALKESGELVPIALNENCVAEPATPQARHCDREVFSQ